MSLLALLLVGMLAGYAFWLLTRLLWSRKTASALTNRVAILASILVGGILVLIAAGRIHWLIGTAAALFPFLRRGIMLLQLAPLLSRMRNWLRSNAAQDTGEKTSGAGSRFVKSTTSELHMQLDQELGTIDGKVLAGEYRGLALNELSGEQLLRLRNSLKEEDSRRLFEVYLDRHHPELKSGPSAGPRDGGASARAGSVEMSTDRAYQLLGLEPGATRDHVVAAHRRLIQKLHPDKGGTHLLASELNFAKKVLLDSLS